ncbi:hypothetical protein Tco_1061539, partial [Tanacetum coccineum]
MFQQIPQLEHFGLRCQEDTDDTESILVHLCWLKVTTILGRFVYTGTFEANPMAKADIGIFVGYAPTKKAYRIYNKRTRKIQETVHVAFDELTEGLTSVQPSSGLAPQHMPSVPNST